LYVNDEYFTIHFDAQKKKKQVVDYDRNVQLSLKQADPEVSPGMWEGDIAGLSPDVII
jgi:hypothetical protein